jgi:hypothetical protein
MATVNMLRRSRQNSNVNTHFTSNSSSQKSKKRPRSPSPDTHDRLHIISRLPRPLESAAGDVLEDQILEPGVVQASTELIDAPAGRGAIAPKKRPRSPPPDAHDQRHLTHRLPWPNAKRPKLVHFELSLGESAAAGVLEDQMSEPEVAQAFTEPIDALAGRVMVIISNKRPRSPSPDDQQHLIPRLPRPNAKRLKLVHFELSLAAADAIEDQISEPDVAQAFTEPIDAVAGRDNVITSNKRPRSPSPDAHDQQHLIPRLPRPNAKYPKLVHFEHSPGESAAAGIIEDPMLEPEVARAFTEPINTFAGRDVIASNKRPRSPSPDSHDQQHLIPRLPRPNTKRPKLVHFEHSPGQSAAVGGIEYQVSEPEVAQAFTEPIDTVAGRDKVITSKKRPRSPSPDAHDQQHLIPRLPRPNTKRLKLVHFEHSPGESAAAGGIEDQMLEPEVAQAFTEPIDAVAGRDKVIISKKRPRSPSPDAHDWQHLNPRLPRPSAKRPKLLPPGRRARPVRHRRRQQRIVDESARPSIIAGRVATLTENVAEVFSCTLPNHNETSDFRAFHGHSIIVPDSTADRNEENQADEAYEEDEDQDDDTDQDQDGNGNSNDGDDEHSDSDDGDDEDCDSNDGDDEDGDSDDGDDEDSDEDEEEDEYS